jgi:hypothetical protein
MQQDVRVLFFKLATVVVVFGIFLLPGQAQTEKIVHSFSGGADGSNPPGGVVLDANGNLYGVMPGGGTTDGGTVFELSPSSGGTWSKTLLYSFNSKQGDLGYPASNLVFDANLDERRRQLAEAKIRKFVVQHRHLLFDNAGNMVQAYCVGILAVAPDGNARFDCGTTFDPQGRCDHVAFLQGTIKDVKFLRNGLLHVATRGMGNYNFYAEGPDLQSAYQELGVLARK